jgi:hypothetical protein
MEVHFMDALKTLATDLESGKVMIVEAKHFHKLEADNQRLLDACEKSWDLLQEVAQMNIQPFPLPLLLIINYGKLSPKLWSKEPKKAKT